MRIWRRVSKAGRLALFALLPATATAGALALPPLLGLAGAAGFRPGMITQAFEKRQIWLWALLAFAAWTAASSLWAIYPDHAQALRLWATLVFGLFFAAAAAETEAAPATRAAAAAALCVTMALLVAEAATHLALNRSFQPAAAEDWEIERNPARGATLVAALVWPVVAYFLGWRRFRLAAALAAIATAGVISAQFHDFGNLAAFLIGLAVFGAAWRAPRLTLRGVSGALALWTIMAPLLTPLLFSSQRLVDTLPYSWAARIGIWRYVCARIGERPWFGFGIDASRAVTDQIEVRGVVQRAVSLHPHSGALQIWFETGGIGAALAAAALLIGGFTLARRLGDNPPKAAAACAAMAALGFCANSSFGIWQEWWNATMLLTAAVVAALPARPKSALG